MDFGAIIADSASSIVTIDGVDRSSVVACGQDSLVFDYDRADCFLNAASSDLENFTDGNKILIEIRPKFSKDLFIIF